MTQPRSLSSSDLPWIDGRQPSVRCHWEGCQTRAHRALELSLAPAGSPIGRPPTKYPFCDWHIEVIKRQILRGEEPHVQLAYHPDDVGGLDANEEMQETW